MRNLKKQRRIQIIALAAVMLTLSTVLIGYAMRDGINFFRAPSQILAEPPGPTEVFRIGGLVAEGTLIRGQGESIRFEVTDGGANVPVVFTGRSAGSVFRKRRHGRHRTLHQRCL